MHRRPAGRRSHPRPGPGPQRQAGLRRLPHDKVLVLRSLEALAKVANGKATKIIIPSELQNLGGVVPSIKELLTDPKED